jgi:hypothetical protein
MQSVRVEPVDDLALQAARRVDWRFLLPDPDLGRVAYVGAVDGELLAALERFSASVEVVDPSAIRDGDFDLVVLRNPRREALAALERLLPAGGHVYAELDRGAASRPRSAGAWAQALRAAGFEDVQAWWHWPSFDSCAEIASLDEPEAVRFLLARRRSGLHSRALAVVARILLAAGALGAVVPSASVVGRRGGQSGGQP